MTTRTFVDVCNEINSNQINNAQQQFSLANEKVLRVNLAQGESVFLKYGTMIAYEGKIDFARKGQGLGKKIKASLAGESITTVLAKAQTKAVLYLADDGRKVIPFYLNSNESVVVESDHVLAFQTTVEWDIVVLKSVGALLSAGLFSMKFKGPGFVSVLTDQAPLILSTRRDAAIHTDPKNTVLWSGHLKPELKTNIGLKSIFGYDSGEELQMKFEGADGFVMVQPVDNSPKLPKSE